MKMKKEYVWLIPLFILCLPVAAQDVPQVIAHRGYWQSRGAAQNSIASLEHAEQVRAYGAEFDVRMTKDSILVLIHDEAMNGVRIEEAPYAAVKDFVLANGETLPTLREYLEAAKRTKNIKLIFELKIGSKMAPEQIHEAARRSVDLVREKKLQLRTEYITFNLEAAREIIRLDPDAEVYYLSGELSPKELKTAGFAGLDYHYDVMRKNPQWFREARVLGLGINVWTVNDTTVMREMIDQGADFITTDIPGDALKFISTRYNGE
jgi:glycerophosphoryl diester phosphodiesterase